MQKTTTTFIIAIVIVFMIIVFIRINPKGSQIPENKVASESVNTLSVSYVPKGTFRNTETGKVFDYIDNWGYLVSCGLAKCKYVLFDTDDNGNINQIKNSDVDPIIGKIISVSVTGERVDYYIEYKLGVNVYRSHYEADLCAHFKGGSKQCYPPAEKDHNVVVFTDPVDNSKIEQITTFDKMLKAEVLSVVNVEHK